MTEPTAGDGYTPPPPNMSGFNRQRGDSLSSFVTPGTAAAASQGSPSPQRPATSPQPVAPRRETPPQTPEPTVVAGPGTDPVPEVPPADPEPQQERAVSGAAASTTGPPRLDVDVDDETALIVTPTVVTVPQPLIRRYERARRTAESNTAVVLDALRTHLQSLPQLVAAGRHPVAAAAGEPFPWRAITARRSAVARVHRVQLPIRPLAGELRVIDALVDWVQQELGSGPRALGGRVTRSEVIVAALDAYLPAERRPASQPRAGRRNPTTQVRSSGASTTTGEDITGQ